MVDKHAIIACLVERVSPIFIVLFGSATNGFFRNDSDIDIAYLSETSLTSYERFMLAQELASQLNRDVDLIDLKEASIVFRVEIIQSGKIIYCSDDTKRMWYEMRALKMYAKLNEERKPVLDTINEKGTIYGE
ncbi:type VII toxin-antitoxin system MntA family adenylyltransferase antitoxin [Alkalihalobacillus hemicellulosilyticus]|uniref:type VII toxin-antitoxin system MntA family adenylyltransferase antitoxin n=1 Tax=Halalkalibacter hemicellulosilyticus TaxID=127886 RepID=UPI000B12DCA3|nr:nucleotidyltransferase domain-containing protein [Halalkalibacter hemicellulosilyticus]